MTVPSVPSTDGPDAGVPTTDRVEVPAEPAPAAAAVPPVDGDAVAPRSRRRRWWLWGSVAAVLLALLAGALFIPTPYYLFQPGSVRPAETRVEVEGAPSYETKGDVLFTTVYVDQATLATLLRGVFDDAVEIKSEEDVYGPEGKDASREANQERMDLSKLVATKVALDYLEIPASFTGDGATVLGLSEDSPSTGQLRVGDVITSVAGTPIALPDDIGAALAGKQPGETVPVTARRGAGDDATTVDVEITLGAAPVEEGTDPATATPRPILGVSVDPYRPSIDSSVQVQIDSGSVTGPSAGLAWALAVVDRLTPESLTDGKDVAVTGEILADGSVGTIGGIVQKVAAVKRAGVSTFLYPADTPEDEQAQMREVAGDAVELHPVHTLQEAVDVLHPGGVHTTSG